MKTQLDNNLAQCIADFSREMMSSQIHSTSFFNDSLLTLLYDYFNIPNLSLLFYDEDFNLLSSIKFKHNSSPPVLSDSAYSCYYKRNPIFYAINDFCSTHNVLNSALPLLFQSSKVFPLTDGYDSSEYVHFLEQAYGYHYGVIMPFGSKGQYRLCVHKTKDDMDFSDVELDVLSTLYRLISSAFDSFSHIQQLRVCSELKTLLFNDKQIGYILLDQDMKPVEYNRLATSYLLSATGKSSLQDALAYLSSLFFESRPQTDKPVEKLLNGYCLSYQPYLLRNSLNRFQVFVRLTIQPAAPRAATPQQLSESPFRLLSARELEIARQCALGNTYQQTADALFISLSTVRNHVQSIFKKLDISNQRQLVALYLQHFPAETP